MRIPMGDFEVAGPAAPVEHTNVNTSGITAGIEAAGRAAGDVANLANHLAHQRDEQDDALGRAKAANALTEHDLQVRALTDDVAGRVQRGEIPYDKAEETFRDEAGKIKTPPLTLPPDAAVRYQGGVHSNVLAGTLTVGNAVKKAKRDDGQGQFNAAMDLAGKEAIAPGADIDKINADLEAWRPNARQFGLDDSTISTKIQDTKDRNWTSQATARILTSRNDVTGLKQIESDLTEEKGFYAGRLDPEKRNALLSQVQAHEQRLANNLATDANKREAAAERAVTFMADANATGIPLLPEKLIELQGVAAGTTHAQDFADQVAIGKEVATVKGQPFAAQQQYIDQRQAEISHGSADPKRDVARLTTLRNALASGRKQAAESPMLFYQNQGGEDVPPLDLSKLQEADGRQAIGAQLADRYDLLTAMRAKYGPDVAMNPWRPEEAAAMKAALVQTNDSPDLKLGLLKLMAEHAPDAHAYRDTIGPIVGSDRVAYVAGQEQYLGHVGAKNGPVAAIILNGDKVLKDKSVALPKEAAFQTAFQDDIGPALENGSEARSDAYLRYKTIYAGLAEKSSHAGDTTELDPELRRTALSLATGGVTTYAGRQTVKPFGWSDHEFTDAANTAFRAAEGPTGYPVEALQQLPMQPVPGYEGMYFLRSMGRLLPGPDGKPILIHLDKPAYAPMDASKQIHDRARAQL